MAESIEIDSDQVVESHLDKVTLLPIFKEYLPEKLCNMEAHRSSEVVAVKGRMLEVRPVFELVIKRPSASQHWRQYMSVLQGYPPGICSD